MNELEGLTPVEHFVVEEAEAGDVLLWELAAALTHNGTQDQRIEAVPLLADAVVSLARHGLVEVHTSPTWPPDPEQAALIPLDRLANVVRDVENWLWPDVSTALIAVSLTDIGSAWL
ncbi:hypothetical protein DQ384_18465 [Sphaerisporangium album]|uniref:Uncharacterized protein n=1 Tax=Sphaerisporangium album TaxID=509200 RepID=A0A367FIB6_9ACTN|nr:hypothetical protein [Sphaerisporangium album]RCG30118.1 hypothetical protein DQ384_18465 [Sphaerisporangium album]